MQRFISRLSIEWKLPIVVCSLLLLLTSSLVSTAYIEAGRSARAAASDRLESVAAQLATMLQAQVRVLVRRTNAVAASAPIHAYLRSQGRRERSAATAALYPVATPQDSTLVAVELWDERGSRLLKDGEAAERLKDASAADRAALAAGTDSAAVGAFRATGNTVVYPTLATVFEDGVRRGLVVHWRRVGSNPRAREPVAKLIGSDATLMIGSAGGAWEDQGEVVAPPPLDSARSGAVIRYQRPGSEARLAAVAAVPGAPWFVAIEFPERAILAPARRFLREMIVIAAALLAVGLVGASLASRRMTGPLRHLTTAAAAMGEGNHAMRVTVNRADELGRLAEAFNHMASRIQAEASARAASEAQFRQAQKMEAVGRLAGGVAHDFNNLLTAIMSYAELIRADLPAGDRSIADVDEIVRAARQAHGLTRQLLAFSRQQVLQPAKLSPNAVVTEVGRMLRRLIGEDIELVTDLDPRVGSVMADHGQIEQVLMNLAVNARDAMRAGGKLTISTVNVELDEASSQLHGVPAGGYVLLSISDTGVGMSAETQARIFEPFYTTKEEGTGLGLATVYGIVTQAGGHVRVYSEPGSGSTFRIYLPRLLEAGAVREPAASDIPASKGSETILLVEDDAAVRTVTAEALERHGYKVLAAHSADEAIALAGRRRGPLDLVMTDVVMPSMNGPALVSRLREVRPGLKLLFMSGYPGGAVLQQGLLDTGIPFLEKPFTLSALAGKVREALDTA